MDTMQNAVNMHEKLAAKMEHNVKAGHSMRTIANELKIHFVKSYKQRRYEIVGVRNLRNVNVSSTDRALATLTLSSRWNE